MASALTGSPTTGIVEPTRRDILFIATGVAGALGVAGATWPLISQMNPDASTIAAGAPVDVDLAGIAEGQILTVTWRGAPMFIRHRTAKEIEEARAVPLDQLLDPATDQSRVQKPEWLIVNGTCTHLGCIPIGHLGNYDGWRCPCHGSQYDTSGRVRVGPAPKNLAVPPYAFLTDTSIRIG